MSKDVLVGVFGIDGSGKTIQVALLRDFLVRRGLLVERPRIQGPSGMLAHRTAWSMGKRNAYDVFSITTLTVCGALDFPRELQSLMFDFVVPR